MSILSLGCSNKPIEKEMKMPMLFDTKEQAEKEGFVSTMFLIYCKFIIFLSLFYK